MSNKPLDFYKDYADKKCEELQGASSTIEKLSSGLGLSNLTNGVKAYLDKGILESLIDSPLRTLAEDVLAQTINENSRRLSQNITSMVKDNKTIQSGITKLQDLRSMAFDSVITVITFKNDMVLYFAAQIAKEAVKAIRQKRRTLIELQEAIRKLHNALLTMVGGGAFFNKYLDDLRAALQKIAAAKKNIDIVHSAFYSSTVFPQHNFQSAKTLLDEAYDLLMPPFTGTDAEDLKKGFLKNVFVGPKYGDQLAMLMAIPKLAMQMLKSYDLYVLKVLKVNALILAFQNCVQNIQALGADSFRKRILDLLEKEQIMLSDLTESMALQLNGDFRALNGPVQVDVSTNRNDVGKITRVVTKPYVPNPTKTSARAIGWSMRIKGARGLLELLDPDALQNLELSNQALRYYNTAVADIAKKDDRKTAVAIMRATDGRERLGDIEADLITFAFQANQAIVDSALTEKENGQFSANSVIALGTKLNSRVQLSIDQDREIEQILMRFIGISEPLLDSIRDMGNSIFRVLEDFGMDKAADSLRSGLFGDFFAMSSKTATYVGAAMSGLALVQNLLQDDSQLQCIQKAVNQIKAEETSKKLSATRNVQVNYAKQQKANEKICKEKKDDKVKVEACSSQIDLNLLKDNPVKSLSGLFNGVFGGSIADSLPFTDKLFPAAGASVLAVTDAANAATKAVASGKAEALKALKDVVPEGVIADGKSFDEMAAGLSPDKIASMVKEAKATGSVTIASVGAVTKIVTNPGAAAKEGLSQAVASVDIGQKLNKQAQDMYKGAIAEPDLFKQIPSIKGVIAEPDLFKQIPSIKGVL